jgi:predicted amidohydrolase
MRICIGQTNPQKGDIAKNIEQHIRLINRAICKNVDVIIFPELSLTGYEPELASVLATNQDDERLDIFQEISNKHKMIIGVGLPTRSGADIFISMIIFSPEKERITYSKQHLYPTEVNIFTPGQHPVYLNIGNKIIAPAICFELSNPEHSQKAFDNNADIYMASVLNSVGDIDGDLEKLSAIARKFQMTVFMANHVGQSGGYQCAGKSSVWNGKGVLIGQLDGQNEGLLIFDTQNNTVTAELIKNIDI